MSTAIKPQQEKLQIFYFIFACNIEAQSCA